MLTDRHAKDRPNDPWLAVVRGLTALHDQKWGDAERELKAAQAAIDGDEKDQLDTYLTTALYQQKRGREAYATLGRNDARFSQLAWRYTGDKDPDGLAALIADHAAAHPDAPLDYWRGEAAYLRDDYPTAIREFATLTAKKDDNSFQQNLARDRLVRCYVRTGDLDEASKIVEAESEKNAFVPLTHVLVTAANGDLIVVREILARQPWQLGVWYRDPDLGKILVSPKFASFRKDHPEPAPFPRPVTVKP